MYTQVPGLERRRYSGPRGHNLESSPGSSGTPPGCSQWSPWHQRNETYGQTTYENRRNKNEDMMWNCVKEWSPPCPVGERMVWSPPRRRSTAAQPPSGGSRLKMEQMTYFSDWSYDDTLKACNSTAQSTNRTPFTLQMHHMYNVHTSEIYIKSTDCLAW